MTTDSAALTLYNYHHLNQSLQKTDAIFVLGSNDIRVAEYAADLFLKGWAPLLIFSGGLGRLTDKTFSKSEAETFADVAIEKGVPVEKIIIENKSTNTGENVRFTLDILDRDNLQVDSYILVQKPYMERRTYATFKKILPDTQCVVASPAISYEDYPNELISKETFLNAMVADLQRIKIYPEKGFQIPQDIPDEVEVAYQFLLGQGFNRQLL